MTYVHFSQQSKEVGGSSHMEEEGLNRSLALLKESGVTLDSIVTDCCPQIQEYLRENNILHFCDPRLLEKGKLPFLPTS